MAYYRCGGGSADKVQFKKYAYFDGTCGIFFGQESSEIDSIRPHSDYKTELKFYDVEYQNSAHVLGLRNSSEYYSLLMHASNNYQCSRGDTNRMNVTSFSVGEHVFVENDENGKIVFDGVEINDYTFSSGIENSETRLRSIATSGGYPAKSSLTYWKGYVEYLKVYSRTSGELLHEVFPALYEDIPCMYDTVTKIFYYTTGLQVVDAIITE